MNQQELSTVAGLLRGQRQAGLGTLPGGAPFVSMVAYAAEPDFGGFLLHLSQLAPHTGALLADPRAALLVSEPDDGRADVQTLTRVTLVGSAAPLEPGSEAYAAAQALYLARLPAAQVLFSFPDFLLFRFVPSEARYVGGFARTFVMTPRHLAQAAAQ